MDTWMLIVGLGLMWTALILLLAALSFPNRFPKFPPSNRQHIPTGDEVFTSQSRVVRDPGDHDA